MVVIAISGYDGTGKTTLAKMLMEFFSELGFKVTYRHEYNYVILNILFKGFNDQKVQKYRRDYLSGKKSLLYFFWPFLVWFDLTIQHLYYRIFERKSIVILDRYFYDHYISFKMLGYSNKLIEILFTKYFPKPDIYLMLWVPPKVAYQRKKNTHSFPFLRRVSLMYLKLIRKLKINVVRTDSNIEHVFRSVLKIIFSNTAFLSFFVAHCKANKVFYLSMKKYNIYKLNKLLAKYYRIYTLKEKIFNDVINNINNSKCHILLKDPKRCFPWIPETDIDVVIFDKGCIPWYTINKLARYFKLDLIWGKRLKYFKNLLNILDLDAYKTKGFLPIQAIVGFIYNNGGLIRFDEYLALKKCINYEFVKSIHDKGLILIIEYINKIKPGKIDFPHFIPLPIYLRILFMTKSSRILKLRILLGRLISEIYYRFTGKLIFHELSR